MQQELFETVGNILPYDGDVKFYPDFFPASEADDFMQRLLLEVNWKQEPIKIFGKEVMQPRLTAWFSNENKSYSYSGITMHPGEWTETLKKIKDRIECVAPIKFNSALLNLYRDGQDSMGWHRDNEKELGVNPVIGSVSFGVTRTFQLRHYVDKGEMRSIGLTHGGLLLMQGETQHRWEHRVPKSGKVVGTRINLTFRKVF